MDELRNPEVLKVVALYPDGLARSRVMTALQRIHDKMWPDVEFDISWVKFDHLEDPQVRTVMGANLVRGDILCFVTRGHGSIPGSVKYWLSGLSFPSERERPLIALLEISSSDTVSTGPSDAGIFLQDLADRHQMDYLPYTTSDPVVEKSQEKTELPERLFLKQRLLYPPQTSSLNE